MITDRILYDARFKCNRLTKGQIGCAIAHVNALNTAISNDYDYVFIFEDDLEIMVNNYDHLKNWLKVLPNDFDLCLLTNVGTYEGVGHDGRIHKNKLSNDINYVTCPYGSQSYYANKNIIKLLYDTQIDMMLKNKIYIADDLFIHCQKEPNIFLNIVTPINVNKFFKHNGFENSILHRLQI